MTENTATETTYEAPTLYVPEEKTCARCGRTKLSYYMTGNYCDTCSLQVAAQLSKDLLAVYAKLSESDLNHIQEHRSRLFLPGL